MQPDVCNRQGLAHVENMRRSHLPQPCGRNALRRSSPPAKLLDAAWQPVAGEVQRQYGRFVNVYAGYTSEETKRKWKWSRQMDQERRFWVKCLKFWAGAPWMCLNPNSVYLSGGTMSCGNVPSLADNVLQELGGWGIDCMMVYFARPVGLTMYALD